MMNDFPKQPSSGLQAENSLVPRAIPFLLFLSYPGYFPLIWMILWNRGSRGLLIWYRNPLWWVVKFCLCVFLAFCKSRIPKWILAFTPGFFSISHGPKFPAVINLISDLHSRNNLENFFTGRISFGREEELWAKSCQATDEPAFLWACRGSSNHRLPVQQRCFSYNWCRIGGRWRIFGSRCWGTRRLNVKFTWK